MSVGSFLGMCYQEPSGCRGSPNRPYRKPTQGVRQKDIHQRYVHRQHFLSVLLVAHWKKAEGNGFGFGVGRAEGL